MFCVGAELESENGDSCFSPIQSVTEDCLLPGTSTHTASEVKAGKALRERSDCQNGRVGDLSHDRKVDESKRGSTSPYLQLSRKGLLGDGDNITSVPKSLV